MLYLKNTAVMCCTGPSCNNVGQLQVSVTDELHIQGVPALAVCVNIFIWAKGTPMETNVCTVYTTDDSGEAGHSVELRHDVGYLWTSGKFDELKYELE